jgi:hypothetical protein
VSILIPDSVDASLVVSALPAGLVYAHIDSILIDSITGAPAGISVVTNPGDSVWLHGGQVVCGLFTGITNATSGNFPINVYVKACAHGSYNGISLDTCVTHNIGTFFNFSLNICGAPACTISATDSAQFSASVHVYPPVLQCITTNVPWSGQINIQVPDSLDISDIITIPGFTIPPGAGFIHVDSIDIAAITGDPTGITSVSNPVLGTWLQPSAFACAAFSGTVNGAVTPAGAYPLTISGTACGHGTFHISTYTFSIDTCIQNFKFTSAFPYTLNVCYPQGINTVDQKVSFNIYPNPNQGTFTVTVSSAYAVSGTMSVVDQLGRTIMSQSIEVNGSKQIALNLGDISAGAYILMINTPESRSVKQFIIK